MFLLVYFTLCLVLEEIQTHPIVDDMDIENPEVIENKIIDSSARENILKLPTDMVNGFSMSILGILNANDKTFTLSLPTNNSNLNAGFHMILDFKEKGLYFEENGNRSLITNYNFNEQNQKDLTFNVRIAARVYNEMNILEIFFEGNEAGEIHVGSCYVDDFRNIRHVVIKGVTWIKNLLFEFKKR